MTEDLHEDSLEEHLFKEPKDLQNWMERIGEILDDQEPGEDIKASLIATLKEDMRSQLRAIKSALSSIHRSQNVDQSFRDFAFDTVDTILNDQDFDALATRLLKAHAEA